MLLLALPTSGRTNARFWPGGGATDAQIAGRLFLSVNTVRSHLERIRDKTGARRRTDLVRYALQAGIESVAPSS
ncbi:MAG: response regulator transcription factor [Streptosporangiaceae bacterium]